MPQKVKKNTPTINCVIQGQCESHKRLPLSFSLKVTFGHKNREKLVLILPTLGNVSLPLLLECATIGFYGVRLFI